MLVNYIRGPIRRIKAPASTATTQVRRLQMNLEIRFLSKIIKAVARLEPKTSLLIVFRAVSKTTATALH